MSDILQCTNCGEYAGSDIAAEIERLRDALGAMMKEKHKAEAEAKLWFEKAQEWQTALKGQDQ